MFFIFYRDLELDEDGKELPWLVAPLHSKSGPETETFVQMLNKQWAGLREYKVVDFNNAELDDVLIIANSIEDRL